LLQADQSLVSRDM